MDRLLIMSFSILIVTFLPMVFGEKSGIFETSTKYSDQSFKIPYEISNGTIENMYFDSVGISLIIIINADGDGTISISLPKNMMDSKLPNGQDDAFFILINGKEIPYKEPTKSLCFRNLVFEINANSKELEIIPSIPHNWKGFTVPDECLSETLVSKEILTPKKQLASGILPEDIICKEGLELIFKSSNGDPICVKLQTEMKLIERGWVQNRSFEVSFLIDKDEYHVGEKITITMKNTGTEPLLTRTKPIRFGIINEENQGVISSSKSGLALTQIGTFHPNDEITFTWEQLDREGKQVKTGTYWVKSSFFMNVGESIHEYEFEKSFRIVEQTDEITEQKIWVELFPINCYGSLCNIEWLSSYYNSSNLQTEPYLGNLRGVDMANTTEFIKDYYKKQEVTIFEVLLTCWGFIV